MSPRSPLASLQARDRPCRSSSSGASVDGGYACASSAGRGARTGGGRAVVPSRGAPDAWRPRRAGRAAASPFCGRLAFLVELDEFVVADARPPAAKPCPRARRPRCLRRTAGWRASRRRCPGSRSRSARVEQLVSTTATTGMPSLRASLHRDVLVADVDDEQRVGQRVHVLDAAERCVRASPSRAPVRATSRLTRRSKVPSSRIVSRSVRRLIDWRTVLKLVSMPPSQRWVTYGMLQRRSASRCDCIACRALRSRRTARGSAVGERAAFTKPVASLNSGSGLFEVDDVDLVAFAEDELAPSWDSRNGSDARNGRLLPASGAWTDWPCANLLEELRASTRPIRQPRAPQRSKHPAGCDGTCVNLSCKPAAVALTVGLPRRRALYTINIFSRQTNSRAYSKLRMAVTVKTPEELAKMRVAGRLAAEVLDMIGEHVRPGVTHRRARRALPRLHRRDAAAPSRPRSTIGASQVDLYLGEPCRLPWHSGSAQAEERRSDQYRRLGHQGRLSRRHEPHVTSSASPRSPPSASARVAHEGLCRGIAAVRSARASGTSAMRSRAMSRARTVRSCASTAGTASAASFTRIRRSCTTAGRARVSRSSRA